MGGRRIVVRQGVPLVAAMTLAVLTLVAEGGAPAVADPDMFDARGAESGGSQSSDALVLGQLIVKFREPLPPAQMRSLLAPQAATLERPMLLSKYALFSVPEGREEDFARRIGSLPQVEIVRPNRLGWWSFTPNDPGFSLQWHLEQINAPAAWDLADGTGVTVAVLDTGVAYEDCAPAVCGATYARAPDLAGTFFVPGYDFVNDDPHANDDYGHGTHMAGTIAQTTHNALGVAGVAFGASIMPVKVGGADGPDEASVIDGIIWATDQGAAVLNLSLGMPASQELESAVDYAFDNGAVLVAASGNGGVDAIGDPFLACPACYPGVIAVGATRYDQTRSYYSNYGSGLGGHTLDLVAAGGDLTVDQNEDTWADGVLQQSFLEWCEGDPTADYTAFTHCFAAGTSMAAAHVSGVAALVLERNSYLTPAEVTSILGDTATDLGPLGYDLEYGYGLLNAEAAVEGALPVGGVAELPEVAGSPLETSGSSGSGIGLVAGVAAAVAVGAVVLGGTALHGIRRRKAR